MPLVRPQTAQIGPAAPVPAHNLTSPPQKLTGEQRLAMGLFVEQVDQHCLEFNQIGLSSDSLVRVCSCVQADEYSLALFECCNICLGSPWPSVLISVDDACRQVARLGTFIGHRTRLPFQAGQNFAAMTTSTVLIGAIL